MAQLDVPVEDTQSRRRPDGTALPQDLPAEGNESGQREDSCKDGSKAQPERPRTKGGHKGR